MTLALDEATDGDLATLARGGSQRAYKTLADRHRASVYRIARGATGDAEEAFDLTQETFVAAFGALDRYDSTRPFASWIARIALNKCRDWSRKRFVRRAFSLPFSATTVGVPTLDPAIDEGVHQRAQLRRVQAAIADLPLRQREVLVLRLIEGLSQAETAEALGISGKAVETRLARARRSLAVAMRAFD